MAMDEKGLGRRLQDARKAAGFTQQSLCQKAGLSYSTLAKIERGAIKAPSIFTIQTIAEALGMGLDALMGVSTSITAPQKMVAANGVRFVYFDVNGCLVRSYHHAFTKIAIDTGATLDMVESAFWHYNDQVCRGTMSMDEFNAALAQRLQVASMDWAKYYLEAVEPITELHELAQWADERYRVGLLTNIMPGLIEAMRASGALPNINYDVIIDSSVVGSLKPEAEIYQIAQERAGCNSEEILFIDDARQNLMAAEHFGWKVLWFDDHEAQASADRIREVLKPAA
jgi:FMN phosphatase YigB (HAD superfamily)/DNA-binding XRE family transcriptional regulator